MPPPQPSPRGPSPPYRRRLWEERCLSDAEPSGTRVGGIFFLSALYETCGTLQQSRPESGETLVMEVFCGGGKTNDRLSLSAG